LKRMAVGSELLVNGHVVRRETLGRYRVDGRHQANALGTADLVSRKPDPAWGPSVRGIGCVAALLEIHAKRDETVSSKVVLHLAQKLDRCYRDLYRALKTAEAGR